MTAATVTLHLRFATGARGRKRLEPATPVSAKPPPPERIPRVARMMALAIHWQGLIRAGTVADQASLARLVGVTRARVTQVMDLLRLAPDLQEAVLCRSPSMRNCGLARHCDLTRIAGEPAWETQRRLWITRA